MNHFLIVPNIFKDKNLQTTRLIIGFIKSHQKDVYITEEAKKYLVDEDIKVCKNEEITQKIDCMIVLGGDGTILNTAREYVHTNKPLLGVNLGRLGFLAEVEKHNACDAIEKLFNDDFTIEKRMMLSTKIIRRGSCIYEGQAFNDAVITRGAFSRMLNLKIKINQKFMDDFLADGMIIATPTGSTGYNLSAGGPIVSPNTQMMVMTPICPHSLNMRSIVSSDKDEIEISITKYSQDKEDEIMLTLDGQEGYRLDYDDEIIITKSCHETQLVKVTENSFYDILREKMFKRG